MEKCIARKFDSAIEGRKIWMDYKKRYCLDETWYLVLFPAHEICLDSKISDLLKEFLARKYVSSALVVYVESFFPLINGGGLYFEKVEEKEMKCLLDYYRLLQFHPNIVVMSLSEPFGNDNIIGCKGITLDDYIHDGLLV